MPIALDSNETIWISLATDKAKPEPSRPAFQCRFLTSAMVRRIRALIRGPSESGAGMDDTSLDQAIEIGIVGWRSIVIDGADVPFTISRLSDVLTVMEKFELAGLMVTETMLAESEKKVSASSPQSAAEQFADSASTDAA